jgi:hypothetical protein
MVIDAAEVFNCKLREWQDYHRPAVLVQKVHTNVSYVSVTMADDACFHDQRHTATVDGISPIMKWPRQLHSAVSGAEVTA